MTDVELNLIVRCLADEAGDDEREKLKEWLNEEENKIQYDEFKIIWLASAGLYMHYSPDLEQARRRIQNGIDRTVKLNSWTWVGKAAAVLILAAGVLVWAISEYSATGDTPFISMEEISTDSAMDSVVLSDGSIVWLNRKTKLKFPLKFTGSERRVFLSGEAFFEVAHNAEMPFIVEARGTVTRVLGTSFNINSGEQDVTVAVRTGKVMFSQHDNSWNFETLEKNEMAAFSHANRSIRKSTIDASRLPFWRSHSLFFENTPLPEVVDRLSVYYNTSIDLDPTIPDDLSLTTSFDNQRIEDVLEVVCAALDLRLKKTTEGYRLVRIENE
jgi:transmembrane sensor